MASEVTYTRGDDELSVLAAFGRTEYQVQTAGALEVGGHVWDFLIAVADLEGLVPTPGDTIDADGVRYEVMALGDDNKGWRYSDPQRTTYRIHAKQTGVTPDDD